MKKPLTRKNSSCKASPNSSIAKPSVQNDNKGCGEEHQESSPLSNNSDKENRNTHKTNEQQITITPNYSSMPNAFTKLMSAKKAVISNAIPIEKESCKEQNGEQLNDSLLDFVEDVETAAKTPVPTLAEQLQLNVKTTLSKEFSTSIEAEHSKDINNSGRRCSRRIQKNREIAEARRIQFSLLEETSPPRRRNSKSKRISRRSITTPNKMEDNQNCTDSLDTDIMSGHDELTCGDITNLYDSKRNEVTKGKNTWKTASIFLMNHKIGRKIICEPIAEDPEKVAARKAFLLSSVPQLLRNQVVSSKEDEDLVQKATSHFSSIGHIKQINPENPLWKLNQLDLPIRYQYTDKEYRAKMCQETTKNLKSKDWSLLNSKCSKKNGYYEQQIHTAEAYESIRFHVSQIYNYVKTMKSEEQKNSISSQQQSTSISRIERQDLAMKQHQSFPINKIFRRYLERKLDADTLESEAKRKNISLNEIEEERLTTSRKLRRRVRRHSGGNKKCKKQNQELIQDSTNFDDHQDNPKIKYDPNLVSSMVWTMKYAPAILDDVIGNLGVVRKLKKWLSEWEKRDVEKRKKRQRCVKGDSDSSDFDSDYFGNSGSTSDEEDKLQNTALLGKVSFVCILKYQM